MSIELRQAVSNALRLAALAGAVAVGLPLPAGAAAEPAQLEEVMVRATRRADETALQETPISVSAISSAEIDDLVTRDISGFAQSVPGFSASRITGFNAASFAMRGVGLTTIIVYQDSPVGVQVDDFVMPSIQTQLLDTFDIASAEVLRGPQGTLFGKNTTGGAVNITTKRPNMSDVGGEVRLSYGSFSEKRVQGAIDLPLAKDKFALRLVGSMVKSDGYYKLGATYGPLNTLNAFLCPTPPPGVRACLAPFTIPGITGQEGAGTGKRDGGDDVVTGRVKAQWNITEDVTALLQYEYLRDRSDDVPSFNDTPPGGPYLWNLLGFTRPEGDPLDHMGSTQRDDQLLRMSHGQKIDVDGIYLNLDWKISDSYAFFFVAGKRDQDEHLPNTYTGAAPVSTLTNQVLSLFDATRDTTRETTQFEARIASNLDGPFNYVAGAFHQKNDATFCVVQVLGFIDLALPNEDFGAPSPFQPSNSSSSVLCNAQDSKSLAGFFDLTYNVNDRFQLGAGFRYTEDKKNWQGRTQVPWYLLDNVPDDPAKGEFSLTVADFTDPLQAANFSKYPGGTYVNSSTPGYEDVLKKTWSEPTWRVTGSYKFTDQLFSYLTVSRGYKAGGYNDQTGTSGLMVASLARPVDPEFANNYELGFKFETADKRLRFNPTIYYTKYKDVQRDLNIITTRGGATFQETVFYNAAKVTSKGAELEFQALITDNFRIHAQASYLDAKYDSFIIDQPGIVDPATGGQILPFFGDFSGQPVPRSPKKSGAIGGVYTLPVGTGSMNFAADAYYEDKNLFYVSAAGSQYDAYLNSKTLISASVTYTAEDDRYFVRAFGKNLNDERYRVAHQSVATLWSFSQWGAPRSFGVEVGYRFGQ